LAGSRSGKIRLSDCRIRQITPSSSVPILSPSEYINEQRTGFQRADYVERDLLLGRDLLSGHGNRQPLLRADQVFAIVGPLVDLDPDDHGVKIARLGRVAGGHHRAGFILVSGNFDYYICPAM
jgi:hypothetical protein